MDLFRYLLFCSHFLLILITLLKDVHTTRKTCSGFRRNPAFDNLALNTSTFRIQVRNEIHHPMCIQRCFQHGSDCAGVLVNENLQLCWFLKCFLTERFLQRGLLTVSSGWKYYLEENKCRPDWVPYNGHCYLYVDSVKDTWFGAKTRCNELGGYLVEIDDEDENTWLVSTFPVDELDGVSVYKKVVLIGASSERESGPYTWSHSGLPVVYQPWYPTEPSTDGGSEHCVVVMAVGYWNNIPCQIQKHFVCESD
ncbi:snaclec rhinocetin subunit beta-like [Crassostrea virginica]